MTAQYFLVTRIEYYGGITVNTNTSFFFLKANGVIFMMHILSINLFYGKKILMFSTYADFMSFNVDVPTLFFSFKALLYSSVQKTT